MELAGLSIPIPTQFADDGSLDLARNARFARALADAKVDHLFVLGSLGEFPSVTDEERPELQRVVIESATGKTDVWVGAGAPSTRRAVGYAESAEAEGAAAVVVVPPYYLHPTGAAVERYYRAIRAAVSLPIVAYNIPSLVGYALPPVLVHRLAAEKVVAGVKDTAGSFESVTGFLRGAPEGFAVFPGDDAFASRAIAAGAQGAVMGIANLAPRLCTELVNAGRSGDAGLAQERQTLVDLLVEVVRAGPFPSTVKFLAARLRGAEVGYRSPYDPLAPEEESLVLARLEPLRERLQPFLRR